MVNKRVVFVSGVECVRKILGVRGIGIFWDDKIVIFR